jgi:hypothetical protein
MTRWWFYLFLAAIPVLTLGAIAKAMVGNHVSGTSDLIDAARRNAEADQFKPLTEDPQFQRGAGKICTNELIGGILSGDKTARCALR